MARLNGNGLDNLELDISGGKLKVQNPKPKPGPKPKSRLNSTDPSSPRTPKPKPQGEGKGKSKTIANVNLREYKDLPSSGASRMLLNRYQASVAYNDPKVVVAVVDLANGSVILLKNITGKARIYNNDTDVKVAIVGSDGSGTLIEIWVADFNIKFKCTIVQRFGGSSISDMVSAPASPVKPVKFYVGTKIG